MVSGRPDKRSLNLMTAIFLTVMVIGIDLTYHPEVGVEYNDDFYEHPDSVDFFPDFNASSEMYVVDIFDAKENKTIERGKFMAMSTLQGLVNREQARVYIDVKGEANGWDWDGPYSFFRDHYADQLNITITIIGADEYFDMFIQYAKGIVVYDTGNEHTMNIAAMLCGINQWVSADRETARWLEERYELQIKEDLRGKWKGNRAEIYERAFEELYPLCNDRILFTSYPKVWGTDYLVACRGFVFSVNPGPFSMPAERKLTQRILMETPADIPVMGWFLQPTGVEENLMIQLASRTGKIFTGGYKIPNKSFLTAFPSPWNHTNPINSPYINEHGSYPDIIPMEEADGEDGSMLVDIENKVYISLAVTDGDNLGFMAIKMWDTLWNSSIRGTVPLAWSMNPLMREVMPSNLDYFYRTATENDTFVCGPSGSGYFYPGFTSDEQRELWLERTAVGMEALNMRHIWLLNSFTTYETPYSEETLDDYVRILEPDGIMLDYGDVPEGRKYWMQGTEGLDGEVAAPVIRSMHIWGDVESFMAKLLVECQGVDEDEPIFAFAPIMSAHLPLETIPDLIERLDERTDEMGRTYEFVSIDDLFYLMERYYVERALRENENIGALEGWIGGEHIREGDDEVAHMASVTEGERGSTAATGREGRDRHLIAYHAYRAIESYQRAEDRQAFLVSLVTVCLGCVAAGWYLWSREVSDDPDRRGGSLKGSVTGTLLGSESLIIPFLLLFTTWMIFLSSTYRVIFSNFWNFAFFGPALLLIMIQPRLARSSRNLFRKLNNPERLSELTQGPTLPVVLLCISSIGLFYHTLFYIFIPLSVSLLVVRAIRGLGSRALDGIVISMALSVSLSQLIIPFSFLPMGLLLVWMGFSAVALSMEEGTRELNAVIPDESSKPDGAHEIQGTSEIHGTTPFTKPHIIAGILTFFIAIQDIPYNRYLSIVTGYRMDYLSTTAYLLPLLSVIPGYALFRYFESRERPLGGLIWSLAALAALPASLVIMLGVMDGRIAIFLIFWLYGSALISAALSTRYLPHAEAGERMSVPQGSDKGNADPVTGENLSMKNAYRTMCLLMGFIILALILSTVPPIALTVYVISLPIPLAFILYHYPLALLLLSGILLMQPGMIVLKRKCSTCRDNTS